MENDDLPASKYIFKWREWRTAQEYFKAGS